MKRIAKILDRDPVVPELSYIVFAEHGAIVWNGQIAVRFDLTKVGTAIARMVKQHGTFAVIDALKFLRIAGSLEKAADKVAMDTTTSQLRLTLSGKRGTIEIPVARTLPADIAHLAIDWTGAREEGNEEFDKVPLDTVWRDAGDLITRDGVNLWGDVIGVYDTQDWVAAFDYGVLLYHNKTGHEHESSYDMDQSLFCPVTLLDIGLQNMKEAAFGEDELYILGDGVDYYTRPGRQTHVLETMLKLRDEALKGKRYSVKLDLASGLWKRAKLFSNMAVDLLVGGGQMLLKGDNWQEYIGQTDAPDARFVTRISLLERWTVGATEHSISVVDSEWYLLGKTRKGSEFYGALTSLGNEVPQGSDEDTGVEGKFDEGGSQDSDDDAPLF